MGELRTDVSFHNRLDSSHHRTANLSALKEIGIGMVSQLPLNPMHLVDLGVVKSTLTYVLQDMSPPDRKKMKEQMLSEANMPCEFNRKTRDFTELCRWKAAEFRFFILYGFFVLKPYISADAFYHICLLLTSLRLLSGDDCKDFLDVSSNFLYEFVKNFSRFYEIVHVNYNMHSLLHLPQNVKLYGPLHSFSGYKCKNHMKEIKKLIKSPSNITKQLHNRFAERDFINEQIYKYNLNPLKSFPGCSKSNSNFKFNFTTFSTLIKDSFCLG